MSVCYHCPRSISHLLSYQDSRGVTLAVWRNTGVLTLTYMAEVVTYMAEVVLSVLGFAEGFERSGWTGALELRLDLEAGSSCGQMLLWCRPRQQWHFVPELQSQQWWSLHTQMKHCPEPFSTSRQASAVATFLHDNDVWLNAVHTIWTLTTSHEGRNTR